MPGLRDTAFAETWQSPTEGRGAITAIAFSPGDRLLAVGLEGGAVSVWDTNSGQKLPMMEDPGCTVQSVAFSTAAKLVAAACADGRVSVWKIADGSRTEVIQKGKAYLQRVAFIEGDRLLALGFADGKVQAWDLSAPSPRISQSRDLSHEDPLLAAFSPDLRLMAIADTAGTVRLRDTVTGQILASHTEQEQANHIQSIAFEPLGEMLAWGAGHQFAMLDSPATVRLWARSGGEGPAVLTGHRRGVTALAFSADARMLASGSADGTVRLWKTRSKQLVAVLNSANGRVSQLSFSGDGRTLAVASVGPWNDFRPGAASVQLFEVSEARLTGALAQSSHEFMAVAFSPDGTKLYSGSQDGTVGIWDTVAGTRVAELGGHSGPVTTLACSADGTTLISGSGDRFNINKYQDTSVRIWSLREANQRAKIESRGAVTGMAISRHSDLGWVSADGSLRIGDRWLRRPGRRDSEPLLSAAYSPDGTVLATGSGSILQEGDWWSGFRLWEVSTGRQLLQKELPVPVWTVAFSPDGNTLATGSGDFLGRHPLLNDLVCFWKISDGTKKGCLDIPHQRVVYSVAYSPRGDILVSGGRDGTLYLWDPVHLTELARLPIHEKAIFGVAFSPDGRTVASASGDGTIRLTDISVLYSLFADGKPTANFAAVLDASRFLLPFELDRLDLRTKTARSLETGRFSGDAKNLQRLLNPRPPGTDPVRWMLREQQASR